MAAIHDTATRVHEDEMHLDHLPQQHHEGHDHEDGHEHAFELVEVLRVLFVALAAAAVWFHLWEPFHRVSVIGLAATLIGGYPIFKEAVGLLYLGGCKNGFDHDCEGVHASSVVPGLGKPVEEFTVVFELYSSTAKP